MAEKIRLNKLISESGICSRREADRYIEIGQVLVNGKKAEIGTLVDKHDKVMVNGMLIERRDEDEFVLLAFNKPRGIISTTENIQNNIIEYVGYHERIFPIGRLDKDSQGLIFLTNNGDIVNKILRAGNQHEKEYIVSVDKSITDDFILKMENGVPILGTMTKKCKVEKINPNTFRIILIQGLNRQIRRMCEYFGYQVVKLERIRIMNITLKGIGLGEWRLLDEKELEILNKAIAKSKKSDKSAETSKAKAKTPERNKRISEKRTSNKKISHEKPKQKNNHQSKKSFGRNTSNGTPRSQSTSKQQKRR